MATDKIAENKIIEEANNLYTPVYKPLFSIFNKRQAYDEFNGTMKFVETDAIGDLRAHEITAQDTEGKHIAVGQDSKIYNKYFSGINYTVSSYQSESNINQITARVLETFNKQLDEEIFTGAPNAAGIIRNNGIYGTNDKNVVKKSNIALANTSIDTIIDFFVSLIKTAEEFVGNAEKTILLGGKLKTLLSKVIPNTAVLYKTLIRDAFSSPTNLVFLPSNLEALLPSGSSIAQVLTLDMILFRHSAMPRLKSQGYDAKAEESWFKFFYGSAMVDIEQYGASLIQPVTISAS